MGREDKVIESYEVEAETNVMVRILENKGEFVKRYELQFPEIGEGTRALLNEIKSKVILGTNLNAEKTLDSKYLESLKGQFNEKAVKLLEKSLPQLDKDNKQQLLALLIHEMLGLGQIEFILSDGNLEEIVINSAKDPVWVYHKKYGWLKSNVYIRPEGEIQNYASIIARRVGKQITVLNPLLDAHLITGDRANATLSPISSFGNTITIRRFRRDPWTVTDFINNKTVTAEVMSVIWMAMQYEMNIIISGGTASGKTSVLNVFLPFIQPNQRVISIEDTREIMLPDYMHWVPMTTREPNAEEKGGVEMLDLLVNSLRMRPDRIVVGEIRRQREAEVLFEAMHTGHSTYTTVHANTAEETIRRLVSPPIEVPIAMLEAVHLNVVMFRNRRIGARRMLQLAEFIPQRTGSGDQTILKPNILYRWKASGDIIEKYSTPLRFYDELSLHTGFTSFEIEKDLETRRKIFEWMVKNNIRSLSQVGKVMAEYYINPDYVIKLATENKKMDF